MSGLGIDLNGLTPLEVIKRYPEQALSVMRKSIRINERNILKRSIELAEEFRKEHPSQPSTDRICMFIEFLEKKLDKTPI